MKEDGVWRTISGRKVFIKDGQSLSDAMKESGKFPSAKNQKKKPEEEEEDLSKLTEDQLADLKRQLLNDMKKEGISESEKKKLQAKYDKVDEEGSKRWYDRKNKEKSGFKPEADDDLKQIAIQAWEEGDITQKELEDEYFGGDKDKATRAQFEFFDKQDGGTQTENALKAYRDGDITKQELIRDYFYGNEDIYKEKINTKYALEFGDSSQNYSDTKDISFAAKEKAVLQKEAQDLAEKGYNSDYWDKVNKAPLKTFKDGEQLSGDELQQRMEHNREVLSNIRTEKSFDKENIFNLDQKELEKKLSKMSDNEVVETAKLLNSNDNSHPYKDNAITQEYYKRFGDNNFRLKKDPAEIESFIKNGYRRPWSDVKADDQKLSAAEAIRSNKLDYEDDGLGGTYSYGDYGKGYYVQFQDRKSYKHDDITKHPNASPRESTYTWGRVWKDGELIKNFEGNKYDVRQQAAEFLGGKSEKRKVDSTGTYAYNKEDQAEVNKNFIKRASEEARSKNKQNKQKIANAIGKKAAEPEYGRSKVGLKISDYTDSEINEEIEHSRRMMREYERRLKKSGLDPEQRESYEDRAGSFESLLDDLLSEKKRRENKKS